MAVDAVEIALSEVLGFCDGALLCAVMCVSRGWHRIFCFLNAPRQALFQAVCFQRWPWLRNSLMWSHSGHHLWHHYFGSYQALCCDANRANAVCSLEVVVPVDDDRINCVQGPWVVMPQRGIRLRINAHPAGNRRLTRSHISAYLEVQAPLHNKEPWHAALDFTFVAQGGLHAKPPHRDFSWTSGPVRFLEHATGGARLDWGCHEFMPVEAVEGLRSVTIRGHVAVQDVLIEVLCMDDIMETSHNAAGDFGLCSFNTFSPSSCSSSSPYPHRSGPRVARLALPASTTRDGLLTAVSLALMRPVSHIWRFSRSIEANGRFVCNLPEAPRHLLADRSMRIWNNERDDDSIYALLTRWTQGESSGGVRQNFFRLLAEDRLTMPVLQTPSSTCSPSSSSGSARGLASQGASASSHGGTISVFIKHYDQAGALRFRARVALPPPSIELPLLAVLRALAIPISDDASQAWCLIREGSPCDWSDLATLGSLNELEGVLNNHGPLLQGDVLTLCRKEDFANLSKLYHSFYETRVARFVDLYRQEKAQVGGTSFTALCQAMDSLNVDTWRIEQLLTVASAPRPLLSLMEHLPGLHPQFFCDLCGTRDLRGFRYNCLVCSDFDLCGECYAQAHFDEHEQRTIAEDAVKSQDHTGRRHLSWHRLVQIGPALPEDCLKLS